MMPAREEGVAREAPSQRSAHGPGEPVRVIVVDDHPVVRAGLVALINEASGMTVCCDAATPDAALSLIRTRQPHVAVIDLMLGRENGLELVAAISRSQPSVHVLVLSGHDERLYADRALKAGALGYIMKDQAGTELLAAIRRVSEGKSYVSPTTSDHILTTLSTAGRRAAQKPEHRLSDRERHVLTLVGRGLGTSAIADYLDISIKTVESHYAHIKEKLGIHNSRELTRVAVTWAERDSLA